MSLFTSTAAAALLAEVEKIPAAAMQFARAEVGKLETKLESRFAALESKMETDIGADIDNKVKAALERLEGEGLDLSGLKSAIGGMTGADLGEADDEAPKPEESKRADIGSLAASTGDGFHDFSQAHPDPASDQPKLDPVGTGKRAADAARDAGADPVAAAARAAFAAVKGVEGFDALAEARDAAAREGAGPVEAQRHADAVLNEDVAAGPHGA